MWKSHLINRINVFKSKHKIYPDILLCSKEEYNELKETFQMMSYRIRFPIIQRPHFNMKETVIPDHTIASEKSVDLEIRIIHPSVGIMLCKK